MLEKKNTIGHVRSSVFQIKPVHVDRMPHTHGEFRPGPVFATLVCLVAGALTAYYFRTMRKNRPVLDPATFRAFPLVEKTVVSHNSCIYRFALPHSTSVLNLPIGQHVSIGAVIDGKEIVRSYTPISTNEEHGHFDLLIKTYENGNISRHVDACKIGGTVDFRGPKGFFTYERNMKRSLGMIAGGTGIAPMFQIILAIMRDPLDKTEVRLIYANVAENDILLKAELDLWAEQYPDQFQVHYVLNQAPEGWKGSIGFVTPELMGDFLPSPLDETKLLLCGPPPMISAMKKAAVLLGYEKAKPVSKLVDQVFVF